MMKKIMLMSITVLTITVAFFGTTATVSADSVDPAVSAPTVSGQRGPGGNGRGTGLQDPILGDEILHDEIIAGFAEETGLAVDEITARLDAGETLADIAVAAGISISEFHELLDKVFSEAISTALANGEITQEQADWLLSRRGRMNNGGFAPGMSGICDDVPGSQVGYGRGGRGNPAPDLP